MIRKAVEIRLYPNKAQAHDFRRFQGGLRRLWNDMLAATREQRDNTGKFMTKRELQDFAVAWKRAPETAWGQELPAHAILQLSADMHGAFVNFYEGRARFPRFRGKQHRQFSIYAVNQQTQFDRNRIKLPKVGWMRWRGGDLPEGRLLSARIRLDAGDRWMLSAVFECKPVEAPAPEVDRVGIDMGLSPLATIFDGEKSDKVAAGQKLRKAERRLRRAQRRLSRCQKGSARRQRAKQGVANIHRKVRNQRKDMAHQATGRIVRRAGEIRVESLNIKGMAKNGNIARSVHDAAMGEFLRQLKYKAEWLGRTVIEADKWFASTQICSACGTKNPHMKSLSRRILRCECGHEMDRDENAAVNLYWYGEDTPEPAVKPTRVEIGEQAAEQSVQPVPVVETRMFAAHEVFP